MPDRTVFRLGSAAAILGSLLAIGANVLHPRPSGFEDPLASQLAMVRGSELWIPIHLVALASTLLIAFGLFAILRSLKGGPAEGHARVGLGALLVSLPLALVALAIDAYGLKAASDAVAAGGEGALGAAAAVGHVEWATFMLFTLTFVGIAPMTLGWAISASDEYPSVFGWPVAALGFGSVIAATLGLAAGPSRAFFILFAITSGLLTVAVLGLGVILWRRTASGAVPSRAGATA